MASPSFFKPVRETTTDVKAPTFRCIQSRATRLGADIRDGRWDAENGEHTARLHDATGPISQAEDEMTTETRDVCLMCGRRLDVPGDELSTDCGGDCWGCVGQIEADGGHPESVARVADERARGVRT